MTLRQKQELFSELEARWVLWVLSNTGVKLRQGEGRILPLGPDGKTGRAAREVGSGKTVYVQDRVHMAGGMHYQGLAKDWQLFVDGQHITNGDHIWWQRCGEKWKSMHPLCRWGGDWGDGNHISFEHGGKQ